MPRIRQIVQVEPVPKKWLNKEEAKKYLGCTDKFLQTLRNEAQITFARYGSKTHLAPTGRAARILQV